MQIQRFVGSMYEKYGNDPTRKVLSTQDLHQELSSWVYGTGNDAHDLAEEVSKLRECLKNVKEILKSSTYSRSLYNIEACLNDLKGKKHEETKNNSSTL